MRSARNWLRLALVWAAAIGTLTACAGPARPTAGNAPGGADEPQRTLAQRTLVLITRQEAPSVSGTSLVPGAFTTNSQRRPFNAWLTYSDENDTPLPYLAEALPQLNTESWKVFPDGRMETTYRLKPNVTWHDGTPLTAEDFVFAWQVYTNPDFPTAGTRPHIAMEAVTAPDPRSVVITWKQAYYDAGMLNTNWTPLPRHLLEAALPQGRDFFLNRPYWTTQFVGLGPYRLDRWEPGAFIEGSSFAGHVWGTPKIDRIRINFIGDAEVVLTSLLSGDGHIPVDNSIRVQQALVLSARWAATNGGTIVYQPTLWRWATVQHRPEYANPPDIRDLRVRRALMHAMNKQELNDTILDGKGIMADTFIPPGVSYAADLDRAITKYPFDVRRAEQIMQEAGYQKGPDGFFTGPEGKLVFEYRVNTSAQNDAERSVMADGWRKAGFAFDEANFSPIETTQGELAATFRSLWATSGGGGDAWTSVLLSTVIPGPANGWRGSNRSGWANAEYDRLVNSFNNSLVRSEREQTIVQVAKIVTEQLPVLPLFFNPAPWAWPTSLQGVRINAPNTEPTWNIHEWELRYGGDTRGAVQ
jgi:peptide/nickel transport system substrate-binding protein